MKQLHDVIKRPKKGVAKQLNLRTGGDVGVQVVHTVSQELEISLRLVGPILEGITRNPVEFSPAALPEL